MKKILALVLVLIMALGLAACAAPAAPAEEPTPAAEPETEKVDSQAILAELKTPAEESNWERTTSSQEVIDFLKVVAEHSAGRIILDTTGAEKLVGKGDMLYFPLGDAKPTRVQGCFITPEEIDRVVKFVKDEAGEAHYDQDVIEKIRQARLNGFTHYMIVVAEGAASGMAGSMPAASEVEEVSSEVRVLPGEEGVVMPIDQGSLEEMKTGSYKFAANISSVDAKKRQMTLTVYGYDAYRAEDVDALDVGSVFSTHLDGAVEAQNVTVEKIEKNEDNGTVSINGGIEEGGVDLWRSGDIYRTVTYDDYPVYYMVGELVLPVDDSVTLSDSSASVDAVPVETNGAIEVGKAVSEDKDNWTPYNTTVFTKDGVVSNILRIWVP